MKCPVCEEEMQEGGIIANSVSVGWVPLEEFQKRGMKRLLYTDFHTIGKSNVLLDQTRVPGAWYCKRCHKVTGIFDVTNQELF